MSTTFHIVLTKKSNFSVSKTTIGRLSPLAAGEASLFSE